MKNKFDGTSYHDVLFDSAWADARAEVEANPNLIAYADLESGFPMVMLRTQYERMMEQVESFRKPLTTEQKSKIVFFGTGGDMEKGNFNDIFTNPANFGFKDGE